jgi:hypothetical protein
VFRRLIGMIGGALNPGSIAAIFKRVAQWIGMPGRFVAQLSGQSTVTADDVAACGAVIGKAGLA